MLYPFNLSLSTREASNGTGNCAARVIPSEPYGSRALFVTWSILLSHVSFMNSAVIGLNPPHPQKRGQLPPPLLGSVALCCVSSVHV